MGGWGSLSFMDSRYHPKALKMRSRATYLPVFNTTKLALLGHVLGGYEMEHGYELGGSSNQLTGPRRLFSYFHLLYCSRYSNNAYSLFDPLVSGCLENTKPNRWGEV